MSAQEIYSAFKNKASVVAQRDYEYAEKASAYVVVDGEWLALTQTTCIDHGTAVSVMQVDLPIESCYPMSNGTLAFAPLCEQCVIERERAKRIVTETVERIITFLKVTMEPHDGFSPNEIERFLAWARICCQEDPLGWIKRQGARTIRGVNTDAVVAAWRKHDSQLGYERLACVEKVPNSYYTGAVSK